MVKYDFKQVENDIEKLWSSKKIFQEMTKYDPNKKLFSFLEGPPTANAPPGLHHMEVRVFKDLFCRFKYMQGYTVPRIGGWDCHGLPVEVQVEKKLNLPHKQDILKYGVDKFIKQCKTDVFSNIKDWNKFTQKMAYIIDLDNPYVTLDNNYIESVWWSLKEMHKSGMLYKGHKVVPFCPRCETPLSSHEVAQGYQDVTDQTVVCKFKIKLDKKDLESSKDQNIHRYILAWTTTPWTLPSNLALAVNPKLDYVIVKYYGDEFIIGKDRLHEYFPKDEKKVQIIKQIKGKELIGKEYEPLFLYFKNLKNAFKIIPADYVTMSDGTGVVHQAPAFGEDDYNTCKENKIPFVQPINEDGTFTSEVSDFKGIFVKDADPKIIEYLEDHDLLFAKHKYTHSYPFCWRCKSPLIYYAMDSWFIKVSSIRNKLLKNNENIKWYPETIKDGRFGNWLEGAKDWALSRKKFWGTPLPIWICECKHQEAIGSVAELREKASTKLPQTEIDLHKPIIDDIKLKCPKCKKEMIREPDVIDCWYDSGSAPFAQFHYPFENKEMFEKSHPYDFIAEAIDQTRGWFYTLHVISTILFNKPAFKSVVCAGHVVDENGEKMSKSKGNILNPWEVFDKVGVDAVRMQMCSNAVGDPKRFGYTPINDAIMPYFNILWNSYSYALSYIQKYDFNFSKLNNSDMKLIEKEMQIEDKWIISKTNSFVKKYTENLEIHNYQTCIELLKNFVMDDLSRTYIKIIRERTQEEDKALIYTLNYIFDKYLRAVAPIIPYSSEFIYQEMFNNKDNNNNNKNTETIHEKTFPKIDKIDEELEHNFMIMLDVTQNALSIREKINLGVRWPLKEMIVESINDDVIKAITKLKENLKIQINVKDIKIVKRFEGVSSVIKPNPTSIGPKFGKDTPKIIAEINKFVSEPDKLLSIFEKKGKHEIKIGNDKFEILPNDVLVSKVINKPFNANNFSNGVIYINEERTKELDAEGFSREIARRIQSERKNAELSKEDKINLELSIDKELENDLKPHLNFIKNRCGADKFLVNPKKSEKLFINSEFKIKDKTIKIAFSKCK